MNKLNFGDIEVTKKELYEGKKAVNLSKVGVDKIVVSNKIKENNETSKFHIGCLNDISGTVTHLCIILPQMSSCIKYFENGRKRYVI